MLVVPSRCMHERRGGAVVAVDHLEVLKRMLVFIAPLTTLVLSEPALVWCTSLAIGQHSGLIELAALAPANIVICRYLYAT